MTAAQTVARDRLAEQIYARMVAGVSPDALSTQQVALHVTSYIARHAIAAATVFTDMLAEHKQAEGAPKA